MLTAVEHYAAKKIRNWTQRAYKAFCSMCGDETVLPTRPDERHPVFCLECYHQRRKRKAS